VQLERGAALLIGRVGRPFVVVGLEQFWWEAAGQLRVRELQLPVGEGDCRVDQPAALDHIGGPQIPVGQRRWRPRWQQRRQGAIARPLEASA